MIVDLISRINLVGLSLLYARYWYNRKGLVCYVYLVYNAYSYSEFSMYVTFNFSQDRPAEVHLLLLYFDVLYISYYYVLFVIITETFPLLIFLNKCICGVLKHTFSLQTSKSTNFQKLSLLTLCNNWKIEIYWGLVDRGKGDSDSDINRLASVILRK